MRGGVGWGGRKIGGGRGGCFYWREFKGMRGLRGLWQGCGR